MSFCCLLHFAVSQERHRKASHLLAWGFLPQVVENPLLLSSEGKITVVAMGPIMLPQKPHFHERLRNSITGGCRVAK